MQLLNGGSTTVDLWFEEEEEEQLEAEVKLKISRRRRRWMLSYCTGNPQQYCRCNYI